MKKFIGISLFCSFVLVAKGQFIDSLQSYVEKKGSFSFSFTTRDSYIDNNYANIFGFDIGVCFANKLTIGGGYNTLASPISQTKQIGSDIVKTTLEFTYFSYFIEYTINLTRHLDLVLSGSVGLGSSSYQYTLYGNEITKNNHAVIPLEPQVELDYNFNKYWGLSTQVGYRYMLINNNLLQYDFNSITYSVGFLISPFQIYAHFFPNTKWANMIENPN